MTNYQATISVVDLPAVVEQINQANGTITTVIFHPYETDGAGAKLIIVWSTS